METPIFSSKQKLIVTTEDPPSSFEVIIEGTAEKAQSADPKEKVISQPGGRTKLTGAVGGTGDAFVIDGAVKEVNGDVQVRTERVGLIPMWVLWVVVGGAALVGLGKIKNAWT